jgi:hypothetical protein
MMSVGGGGVLPVLDLAVLKALEEDLGSPNIAWCFARDYAMIWGRRHEALVVALERKDRSAARDAVISLKISSAMVGGVGLAQLAEALQVLIQGADLRRGDELLARIADYGHATVEELQQNYILKNG